MGGAARLKWRDCKTVKDQEHAELASMQGLHAGRVSARDAGRAPLAGRLGQAAYTTRQVR